MQKRQQFTAEFKREAVRLFKAGDRPAAVVARGLGIPRNRLYKWAQYLEKKGATAFAGSNEDRDTHYSPPSPADAGLVRDAKTGTPTI